MIDNARFDRMPEPVNATDFMNAVIALTPQTPLLLGPVNVEVLLDIDENGRVTRIEAKHELATVRSAAGEAAQVLRFTPAISAGRRVAYRNYGITIGFCPDAGPKGTRARGDGERGAGT